MADITYYTSERFIHDDLILEAESGLSSLYDTWARESRIDPFLLVWPSETVKFHGHKTADVMPFDLPPSRASWGTEIVRIAKETSAYALLLVEQRAKAVVVVLESPHGSKSWHIPIRNHGNVDVLEDPEEKTDVDYIGLLWAPNRGRS